MLTYSRAIEDIEAGKLPKWSNVVMRDIVVRYRSMRDQQRTMKDLLLYSRFELKKQNPER